jgi:hypothetical protein
MAFPRPPPTNAEEERKQQRWAATRNLIDRPGAGFEMAASYDPQVAASNGRADGLLAEKGREHSDKTDA